MKRQILLVNYSENSIPDLERSRFIGDITFQSVRSAEELDFPSFKSSPDIVVIFFQKEKQDCLDRISPGDD